MTRTSTDITNLVITSELVFQAMGEGGGGRLQIWRVNLLASGGTVTLHDLPISSILRADETPIGVTGFYGDTADAAQIAAVKPSARVLYAQKPDGTNATIADGHSIDILLFSLLKVSSAT